ncbi:hypothetical protein ABW20_dc0104952 [Dactylellina cionopaga]|nr:hypothetical protein ABW20_dc0104952 [Dactylellina cionopaga]
MAAIEDIADTLPVSKPHVLLGAEILEAFGEHEEEALDEAITETLERGKGGPPYPNLFQWNLGDSLLCEGHQIKECSNFSEREKFRLYNNEPDYYCNVPAPLPNRLAELCRGAEIRTCSNEECSRVRARLEKTAPTCKWSRFREWAITLLACQACSTDEQKLTKAHFHLLAAIFILRNLLWQYSDDGTDSSRPIEDFIIEANGNKEQIDIFDLYEVLYWMLTIQSHMGLEVGVQAKWGPNSVPKSVVKPAAKAAWEIASKVGICQYRLQKLIDATERKEGDLPGLMATASKYPQLGHSRVGPGSPDFDPDLYHATCTPQRCPPNQADTTIKAQLHKCDPSHRESCYNVQYLVDDLEESIENQGVSAWSIYERHPATVADKVIAISHVWIDGTGIGNGPDPTNRKNMGLVHQCLDKFWRDIVARLGCTAFWWDTISLPTSPAIRTREINGMHRKYSAATHVVVHDNYLVNFDWDDDGSPCIALVLCSWFTRGWTSLELHAANSVKVLYKGSDPMNPVIKDLDDDILAVDPKYATRAYWMASAIIRRLRRQVKSTTDMLSILRPRETCKRQDRTIIAGLLAGLEPPDCLECLETPTPETSIKIKAHIDEHTSRRIIIKYGRLGRASFIHGKETISESGPWSWAPREIHDIPVESEGGDIKVEDFRFGYMIDDLEVYEDGTISGSMDCRRLREEDAQWNIIPADVANDRVTSRIREALVEWENCIILRDSIRGDGPALLAMVVGRTKMSKEDLHAVECRYVGAIALQKDHHNNQLNRNKYSYIPLWVRFGNDEGKSSVKAGEILSLVRVLHGVDRAYQYTYGKDENVEEDDRWEDEGEYQGGKEDGFEDDEDDEDEDGEDDEDDENEDDEDDQDDEDNEDNEDNEDEMNNKKNKY